MAPGAPRRPVIGITGPFGPRQPLALALRACVWACGGRPYTVRTAAPGRRRPLDGLLLAGGTDVHPELYGGVPKRAYAYDRERDELELAWLARARREGLPVLAVCRGAQLMNVAHGGSLHLDVRVAYEGVVRTRNPLRLLLARHPVTVSEGSVLHRVTGARELAVNALHTNSVDRVGEGLAVVAQEPSGVVQALEDPAAPFYLGVQFHPELLPHVRPMRALFRGLVGAARSPEHR
jgi:putative glutamine amidotransferase